MKKTVILTTSAESGVFSPLLEMGEYENMTLITMKNSRRALKKLVRRLKGDESIIVSHPQTQEKIFENVLLPYNEFSQDVILPVLNKICRQTAQKFGMGIPFGEIYIMASPIEAYRIISQLYNLSRLFTVISPEDTIGRMYDELYFKHGTIIRHLPAFNNDIREDAVIIRCDAQTPPAWAKLPVIDMCIKPSEGSLTVQTGGIFISDEKITNIRKFWNGTGGAALYSLIGEMPGENAVVNINKSADRIFLLDTTKI